MAKVLLYNGASPWGVGDIRYDTLTDDPKF